MKKILITGKNSYIGRYFINYTVNKEFDITELDVRNNSWKDHDFSQYDAVFHVAGIAHFSKDRSKKDLYYKVNTELTYEVAKKAKQERVSQFIFMSSIIVYGDSTSKERIITGATTPKPTDFYGDSKWQAELKIGTLRSNEFNIAVVRPPMVYGKGSKGNYPRLSKLAQSLPIFPKYENQRSMIHIDNLCEFIAQIIIRRKDGIFFPQNKDYVSTSDLVKEIALQHGRNIYLTKFFNIFISLMFVNDNIKKLFGNLVYSKELSEYDFEYQVRDFKTSIYLTEKED